MALKWTNRDRENWEDWSGHHFEHGDGSKYEGFEGMNYEQPRQPYQPRKQVVPRIRSGEDPGSTADQQQHS